MKVTVDRQRCMGNGVCEAVAPDVFVVGDDGVATIAHDEIPLTQQELAHEAVLSCPARALTDER